MPWRSIKMPLARSVMARRGERCLQVVVLGESPKHDVDRALQLLGRLDILAVGDAREEEGPDLRRFTVAV
jgi:hypothetical protein